MLGFSGSGTPVGVGTTATVPLSSISTPAPGIRSTDTVSRPERWIALKEVPRRRSFLSRAAAASGLTKSSPPFSRSGSARGTKHSSCRETPTAAHPTYANADARRAPFRERVKSRDTPRVISGAEFAVPDKCSLYFKTSETYLIGHPHCGLLAQSISRLPASRSATALAQPAQNSLAKRGSALGANPLFT
jgi:hypothetical protein